MVGGDLVANTCGGQILSHKLSKKAVSVFRKQAREYGFSEEAYLDALARVPVMPEAQMRTALKVLATSAAVLIESEISHRRQREDDRTYCLLAEKAADCILIHGMDGEIVYINQKGREMVGCSGEEIQGMNIFNLIVPDSGASFEECRQRWLRTHDVSCLYDAKFITGKGVAIPVEVSSSLINREGNVSEILVIARDVAERVQAGNELKECCDHIRLINKILRHDMINNLNVIGSALNLYRDSNEMGLLEEASTRVSRSCALISRMINLENFISLHQGLRIYHAAEVCEQVLKNYRSLSYTVDGDCKVLADEAFDSAVDNIVSNAVIHGKSGRMDVTICREGEFCRIRFADGGSGIPDALKEKVFDEYFTGEATAHSGSGLFIVKKIMERYGGYASIEDNKPQGTTVILTMRMIA